MLRVASARLEVETDLRQAIEAGQLTLAYQPIVALDDRRVAGVEALLRWQHPKRGLLKPEAFIDIAEETGLIVPIGAWVIDEACQQHALWRRASRAFDRVRVHVNVATPQPDRGISSTARWIPRPCSTCCTTNTRRQRPMARPPAGLPQATP